MFLFVGSGVTNTKQNCTSIPQTVTRPLESQCAGVGRKPPFPVPHTYSQRLCPLTTPPVCFHLGLQPVGLGHPGIWVCSPNIAFFLGQPHPHEEKQTALPLWKEYPLPLCLGPLQGGNELQSWPELHQLSKNYLLQKNPPLYFLTALLERGVGWIGLFLFYYHTKCYFKEMSLEEIILKKLLL